jgi:uncharacterized Zn finger protein
MPLISYSCSCGEVVKKYLKSAKDAAPTIECAKCGLDAKKSFGTTSSSYKVTIDLPGMARAIHVDPEIMSHNDQRNNTDYSEED